LLAPDGAAARLGLKQSTLRPDMQKVGTASAPGSGPVQQVPKQGSPMPFFCSQKLIELYEMVSLNDATLRGKVES
jgi:hypothetical protein